MVTVTNLIPPHLLAQPISQSTFPATPVTFNVSAEGTRTLVYQWRFNGVPVPGATSNSFTLTSPTFREAGLYSVLVTNAYGQVLSADASLSVVPLVAAGDNWFGQVTVSPVTTNAISLAAGAWHSLALVGDGPPVTGVQLTNPVWGTNGFSVSFPARSGRVYRLEYKNSLTDSNWTALGLVAGVGGMLELSDPTAVGTARFYRVRQW
jgi:hypothetical protein